MSATKKKLAELIAEYDRGVGAIDESKSIILDETSFRLVSTEQVRPGGVGIKVKAWSTGRNASYAPDLELLLTEFPDVNGVATYFFVKNDNMVKPDIAKSFI